jgi:hypothetical protein
VDEGAVVGAAVTGVALGVPVPGEAHAPRVLVDFFN